MARVSTIPAGVPFVDALAAGLLAEAGGDALALADMLVLLPNRRACRSLRDAFWRVGGGKALALPSIQPIGDLEFDDLLIDVESERDLPPAIGGLRRRLLLIRVLLSRGWTHHQSSRLADDLAALLDELQTERIDLHKLEKLAPEAYAEHWQQSFELLQIIIRFWPAILEDEHALDPAERRHQFLTAIAHRWRTAPPERRIIAAGSTGSIPGTRELLKVIAGLPNGEVVLPGLECELDETSWQEIGPDHPQYGLKQLLASFGLFWQTVPTWRGLDEGATRERRAFLADIMRPSSLEGSWCDGPAIQGDALAGLSLIDHPDPATEATFIAVRLRAALLEEGRTAALITPDRALARRVAVELKRFGIEIDDTAGVPLDQTAPGSFLLLCAKMIIEGVRPVALLSVLKHPLMRAGMNAELARRRARTLDRLCLRGPAIMGGFSDIIGELSDRSGASSEQKSDGSTGDDVSALRDWIESLAEMASPFSDLAKRDDVPLRELIEAHLRFAEALAMTENGSEALWAKEAGEGASALFRELLEAAEPDDRMPPVAYPALIAELMAERPVRPKRPGHPRLWIWGQLEARLQHADLIILAGLNEGIWPRVEEPGAWLNRAMRESLGLPPLERRIGQSAHDFVQAAAGSEVVLSRAEKDLDGSPTVPSRWLIRLKALLVAKGIDPERVEETGDWHAWVERLDLPSGAIRPEDQPRPTPPLALRPRRLSVSDIGLWMRNPYGLYAKHILKLRPLEPLEADPSAADRGQIVHEALERFVDAFPQRLPDDAAEQLRAIGARAFSRFDSRPQVRAIWWPRFLQAAAWVIAEEAAGRDALERVFAEVKGELVLDAPGGAFQLIARADRLERRLDGAVNIIDYKTGSPPTVKDMAGGLSPQLPLEALMLREGAFPTLGRCDVADLLFWRLAGHEQGGESHKRNGVDIDATFDGLLALIGHYDLEATPYPASYRPPTARRDDYDHLARLGEWPN
jgi:ATP-dependent helicase/nuclease subunit B